MYYTVLYIGEKPKYNCQEMIEAGDAKEAAYKMYVKEFAYNDTLRTFVVVAANGDTFKVNVKQIHSTRVEVSRLTSDFEPDQYDLPGL